VVHIFPSNPSYEVATSVDSAFSFDGVDQHQHVVTALHNPLDDHQLSVVEQEDAIFPIPIKPSNFPRHKISRFFPRTRKGGFGASVGRSP
jgi:hypothetical protein